MGLFTGLLTLPLAPVRGAVWVAEQLADEAERQLRDEPRRRLLVAERQLELGQLTVEEYEAIEDEALARLDAEEVRSGRSDGARAERAAARRGRPRREGRGGERGGRSRRRCSPGVRLAA
jgi:hypothetical protein